MHLVWLTYINDAEIFPDGKVFQCPICGWSLGVYTDGSNRPPKQLHPGDARSGHYGASNDITNPQRFVRVKPIEPRPKLV